MPSPPEKREDYDAEAGRSYKHFSESTNTKCSVGQTSSSKRPPWHLQPFDPESRVVEGWDMMFLLVLMLAAFFTPLDVAFDLSLSPTLLVVVWVVNVIFLLDLMLQFATAYHEDQPNHRYVKEFRKIAYRYITSWFIIDLASTLPYQLLPGCEWTRLLRLLRLHRAPSIVRQHQTNIGISFALLSLAKFLVVLFFTCHWIACMWSSIAWHSPEGSWLEALESNKGGDSELYSEWGNVYAISLYWAIMTLTSIGYGDITPQNGREYVLSSVCMAMMAAMWAVVIGQMCGVLATLLPHDVAFKRTMDDLNWMMRDRDMPKSLRSKLRRYFWESRSLNRLMEQRTIIERMSPMLQGVVAKQLSDQWLSKVPYLQSLDQETLVAVARKLTPMLFAPNEAIQQQRALFVVRRGVCMHGGRVLVAGSVWGEDMIVSSESLRDSRTARCLTYLEVLVLRYADLKMSIQSEKSRSIIRWWQIRKAMTAGVMKIASGVNQLQQREHEAFDHLPEEERRVLVARLLHGESIDHFQQRKLSRCSKTLSNLSYSSYVASSETTDVPTHAATGVPTTVVPTAELADMKEAIMRMTETVEQLQQTVLYMSGTC